MIKDVRVRNAPSPTGFLHIGSMRTFLYNFLFARKNNGKFILRIEDTDQNRLVEGSIQDIIETLEIFGLTPDEGFILKNGKVQEIGEFGPYIQSKRLDIYQKHAQELIDKKAAYYCFCTPERLDQLRKEQEAQKLPPKYDKFCLKLNPEEVSRRISSGEKHVIRLNVPPDQKVSFDDLVFGHIEVSTNDIDDQILLKSDGFPTYHLAVVVDDHLMQISHITRSDEFIASTPKHVLIYKAFGWEMPYFVHFPPILSAVTKKKLSKREGDVAVKNFLDKGYLPEAIINFIAFQGWNPKTEQEIFSLIELVQEFSLDKIHKAGAIFDLDKLDWFNSLYIRKLKIEELFALTLPYLIKAKIDTSKYPKQFIEKILLLEQERLKKLSEIGERVAYFFKEPAYEPQILIWKKSDKQIILKNLEKLQQFVQTLAADKFNKQTLETELKQFIQTNGMKNGEVLWPLRVALSGLEASPGPFEIMETFAVLSEGKEIVLRRINAAVEKLF